MVQILCHASHFPQLHELLAKDLLPVLNYNNSSPRREIPLDKTVILLPPCRIGMKQTRNPDGAYSQEFTRKVCLFSPACHEKMPKLSDQGHHDAREYLFQSKNFPLRDFHFFYSSLTRLRIDREEESSRHRHPRTPTWQTRQRRQRWQKFAKSVRTT